MIIIVILAHCYLSTGKYFGMPAEIEKLLQEIRCDNHFAFSRLFDLYKAKIFNFAHKFVLTEDDADEITQMVFVRLWEKRKKIIILNSVDSYLYVLTKNLCFDHLRKISNDRKLLENFLLAYKLESNNVEESLYHKELLINLDTIIEKLPSKQKKVYIMAELEKKSYEEISEAMNITKNTVKTQLKLAKLFVRKNVLNMDNSALFAMYIFILKGSTPL